jgi:hypothetical protein
MQHEMPKNENYIANLGMAMAYGNKPETTPKLVAGEPYKSNYILPEEINETTTIQQVAKSIVNNPNLWGIYSIADAFEGLVQWEVKKRLADINPVG